MLLVDAGAVPCGRVGVCAARRDRGCAEAAALAPALCQRLPAAAHGGHQQSSLHHGVHSFSAEALALALADCSNLKLPHGHLLQYDIEAKPSGK